MTAYAVEELARRETISALESIAPQHEKLSAERELVRSEMQTTEDCAASEVKTMLERVRAESKATEMWAIAMRVEPQAADRFSKSLTS